LFDFSLLFEQTSLKEPSWMSLYKGLLAYLVYLYLKSLGNEVLGWKTLWQSTDKELAMKMLSHSVVFWSLPTPYRSQAQKLNDHFH